MSNNFLHLKIKYFLSFVLFFSFASILLKANDPSDDTPGGAETILVNTNYYGSVDGFTDGWDYYSVTLPTDGAVAIEFSFSGSASYNYIEFGGCLYGYTTSPQSGITEFRGHHLQGATLIIGINGWVGGAVYRSYTLKVILESSIVPNDMEPNNSISEAQPMQAVDSKSGLLNFKWCANPYADFHDYYTFTTTEVGNFSSELNLVSTVLGAANAPAPLEGSITLKDSMGNNLISADGYPWANFTYGNLPAGKYFLDIYAYTSGYNYTITNTFQPDAKILNLKLYLQGYKEAAGLTPVLLNLGISLDSTISDSVEVEVHDQNYPYNTVFSQTRVLNTDGTLMLSIPIQTGFYYIVVKHRNSIETWSANPVAISAITNYDFTTSASKAYGNNQVEVEPGVWAFYSGDVNQDDAIDAFDYVILDPDVISGAFGYLVTDLTGDGVVDAFDYIILDSNLISGVSAVTP
jgi:hypothetical protein